MNLPGPSPTASSPVRLGDPPTAPVALAALLRSARRDLALVGMGVWWSGLALAWAADLGAGQALVALCWFGAGAWLVRQGLRSGSHPHARFGGANRVTALRLALSGWLLGLLVSPAWATALSAPGSAALAWGVVALATLTALLDACDGPLARRSGLASAFGARFDMETDAAFTLVLCALVWQAGQAGPWVLAAGLMRYAFVAAAHGWPWLGAPLAPSRRRQAVCVVQITSLIVCLGPVVSPALATVLAASSLALLTLSFAIDVRSLAVARRVNGPPHP